MGKVFKKYLKERIIDFIAYISEYMYGIISYLLIVGGMAIILNKVSFGNKNIDENVCNNCIISNFGICNMYYQYYS